MIALLAAMSPIITGLMAGRPLSVVIRNVSLPQWLSIAGALVTYSEKDPVLVTVIKRLQVDLPSLPKLLSELQAQVNKPWPHPQEQHAFPWDDFVARLLPTPSSQGTH